MTVHPADLYEMLKKIRYDATAIQGKVTDALNMLAELNLPTAPELRCPHCDLAFRGRIPLDEHVYHSHAGAVPPHWEAIEARSDEPVVDLPPGPPAPVRFTITDGVFSRKARG